MNSAPGAVEPLQALLHLVERHRELPDLVVGVHRDRTREVAVGDLLRGLLEPSQRRACARATSQPAPSAASSAIAPAIRIWRISATASSTSARRWRRRQPSAARRLRQRDRRLAAPLVADSSRPHSQSIRGGRRDRGRNAESTAVRSSSESAITNEGSGPAAPSRTPSTVTRELVSWSMPRTSAARASARSRPPSPDRARACSVPTCSSRRSCSAVRPERSCGTT